MLKQNQTQVRRIYQNEDLFEEQRSNIRSLSRAASHLSCDITRIVHAFTKLMFALNALDSLASAVHPL